MVRQAQARWGAGDVGRVTATQAGDAAARVAISRGDPGRVSTSPQYLLFDGVTGRLLETHDRVGPAAESLDALAASGEDAFDLVFIDADKDGYPTYLEKSVPLVRAGGLIIADNVLQPAVLDPDADTGITRYNAALAARADLVSMITPTLGRGLGGLSISVKGLAAS